MSHSLAACIYAEQLRMHGHGEPLWQPEPRAEDGEVLIGDVGFIEDGRFYRLFNARFPADHPINKDGVPDGFVPLEYNERALLQKNENYLGPTPLYSKSVSTNKVAVGGGAKGAYASYRFTCRSEKGAVLVPGGDITLWHVQRNRAFPEYVRLYHDSWHQFAEAQTRVINAEDIILVTGFLNASEWAVAAISNHGKAHGVSFAAQGVPVAQAEFTLEHDATVEMSVTQRSGPKRSTDSHGGPRDQCLFLKYYKAKRNRFLGRKIVANAEPQGDEHGGGDRQEWSSNLGDSVLGVARNPSVGSLTVEEVPSTMSLNDPLDHALNYILSHSSAEIAVVGHDEMHDLWRNTMTWPDDFYTFLHESKPDVHLDENLVGYLKPKPVSRNKPESPTLSNKDGDTSDVAPPPLDPNQGSYMHPSSHSPRTQRRFTLPVPTHHTEQLPSYDTSEHDARSVHTTSSSATIRPHARTVSVQLAPPAQVQMHWQLLPPNTALGKCIEFDMAFSVRRILKFTHSAMEPFTQSDRDKPALADARITAMTIICPQLAPYDWRLSVEKPGGITCGDVLEGLYAAMNKALTPDELGQYVTEKDRMLVEDAFAERCEILAARGKDVEGEVKRWIDLLHGRRIFGGLGYRKESVWELLIGEPIFQ